MRNSSPACTLFNLPLPHSNRGSMSHMRESTELAKHWRPSTRMFRLPEILAFLTEPLRSLALFCNTANLSRADKAEIVNQITSELVASHSALRNALKKNSEWWWRGQSLRNANHETNRIHAKRPEILHHSSVLPTLTNGPALQLCSNFWNGWLFSPTRLAHLRNS